MQNTSINGRASTILLHTLSPRLQNKIRILLDYASNGRVRSLKLGKLRPYAPRPIGTLAARLSGIDALVGDENASSKKPIII